VGFRSLFGSLPQPFWVLFIGTLINRVGAYWLWISCLGVAAAAAIAFPALLRGSR
jgi:hypothetical protein